MSPFLGLSAILVILVITSYSGYVIAGSERVHSKGHPPYEHICMSFDTAVYSDQWFTVPLYRL